MAWIKFEKDLLTDPRVLRIARTLAGLWKLGENTDSWGPEVIAGPCNEDALPAVTLVCGALVRIWCLADTHVGLDDVLPLGCKEINELLEIPGFCEQMPADWLVPIDDKSVKLPDFHIHNGTEAKKKAVTQKRVQRYRNRNSASLHDVTHQALLDQTKTRPDQTKTRGGVDFDKSLKSTPLAVNHDKTATSSVDNSKGNGGWWKTEDGIQAKGNELGLTANPGESWQQYKDRIFAELAKP